MTNVKLKLSTEQSRMWRSELTKLRCWMSGYKEGRHENVFVPGEDVLRQIIIAIDEVSK